MIANESQIPRHTARPGQRRPLFTVVEAGGPAPRHQAATDLADILLRKHLDLRALRDMLEQAIAHDLRILESPAAPETIATTQNRMDVLRQAIDFIGASRIGETRKWE